MPRRSSRMQDVDQLARADLKRRDDLLELPVVRGEVRDQQQLRLADDSLLLLGAELGERRRPRRRLQQLFQREVQHLADPIQPLQREPAAAQVALHRRLAEPQPLRQLPIGDALLPQARLESASAACANRPPSSLLLWYNNTILGRSPGVTADVSNCPVPAPGPQAACHEDSQPQQVSAMPVHFDSVFVSSTGLFMPGEPVGNDDIDRYIAPLNAASARIKRRILAENGITPRHYAIDADGTTAALQRADGGRGDPRLPAPRRRSSCEDLTDAVHRLLGRRSSRCPASPTWSRASCTRRPMDTSSHQGVCAAGVAALQHAASALELSDAGHALVVGERDAVAHVQALALRAARLRNRLRLALPALDAVRRRRRMLAQQAAARARDCR